MTDDRDPTTFPDPSQVRDVPGRAVPAEQPGPQGDDGAPFRSLSVHACREHTAAATARLVAAVASPSHRLTITIEEEP